MNNKYYKFKVEVKSENGDEWSTTVETVDMIEAYRMVEDTGLDGSEIIRITRL
jgi:hypothetical protein